MAFRSPQQRKAVMSKVLNPYKEASLNMGKMVSDAAISEQLTSMRAAKKAAGEAPPPHPGPQEDLTHDPKVKGMSTGEPGEKHDVIEQDEDGSTPDHNKHSPDASAKEAIAKSSNGQEGETSHDEDPEAVGQRIIRSIAGGNKAKRSVTLGSGGYGGKRK
jgi:hypothetical protein